MKCGWRCTSTNGLYIWVFILQWYWGNHFTLYRKFIIPVILQKVKILNRYRFSMKLLSVLQSQCQCSLMSARTSQLRRKWRFWWLRSGWLIKSLFLSLSNSQRVTRWAQTSSNQQHHQGMSWWPSVCLGLCILLYSLNYLIWIIRANLLQLNMVKAKCHAWLILIHRIIHFSSLRL